MKAIEGKKCTQPASVAPTLREQEGIPALNINSDYKDLSHS